MFNLPHGEAVDAEIDLGVNQMEFPFECGCVSHFKPRAHNPCAHRLVYGGRVVGWLAEAEGKQEFVAGGAARVRLLELSDSHDLKERAVSWTLAQFTVVAREMTEAFADPTEVASLLAQGAAALPIETKNLALLVDRLVESDGVMGAMAFEDGVVIHSSGDLPMGAEQLAVMAQERISGISAMADSIGQDTAMHATLRLDNGNLLLAQTGQAVLTCWCYHATNIDALVSNAAALIDTAPAPVPADEAELPEGFIVKESKGGIDQLITLLRLAQDDSVNGHLESLPTDGGPASVVLVEGVPVGLRESEGATMVEALRTMTIASNRLRLHRLERTAQLGIAGSTVEDWSLAHFTEAIAECRTRSDDRKRLLTGRLDSIYGFDLGIEAMSAGRKSWKMVETTAAGTGKQMPAPGAKVVLQPVGGEIKKRLENLEHTRIQLERDKGRLERELVDSRAARDDAQANATELEETLQAARDDRSSLHREIDDLQAGKRAAESTADDSTALADRLAKRVSELEHMVETRAEELASTLGEMDSREALLNTLSELSSEEARVKGELSSAESRLDEVRKSLDHDERLQRVLSEQVTAQRDKHRVGGTELKELDRRIENQRDELANLEAEAHAHRRLQEEERGRLGDNERKSTIIQSELREMMEERRNLLRELGDLDARKSQSETELRLILEQAEDLQEAHEIALIDIQEAERIRARLSEEPLARALLGDDRGLATLEPVLNRMAHARSRGYSLVLLDRAVERGLSVIQHSVDEVSKTPRYLLSNEVMDLLEQQAPETAGTVRGLTKWSVQSRLEHKLAETVQHVVIDLEGLLDDYEQSVTMLGQLQEVLRGLVELGLPTEDITPMERFSHMPEALPHLSVEVRRLIQRSLDDIYLDADRRSTSDAIGLADTVAVLESLLRRLDTAGLTGEEPKGGLWAFQRHGSLPFEPHHLAAYERPEITREALLHMNPVSAEEGEVVAADGDSSAEEPPSPEPLAASAPASAPTPEASDAPVSNSTWEPIEEPGQDDGVDISTRISAGLTPADTPGTPSELEEISLIEVELAELDAAAAVRQGTEHGIPPPADPEARDALDDLERELSDLDL